MFGTINSILTKIDDLVWGVPLIVMILATGIFLTIRLKGIQVRKLILAFKYMFSNETDGEHGEISSFGALCTALSATIGTGNIVGVATAIVAGGPGALFWMIVAATVGTATKYSECLLAIKYRTVADDGHIVGGPFYYIEKGMGENWKWLAKIFAVFGVMVGLLGIGTFSQINGITSAVNNFFDANNAQVVVPFMAAAYIIAAVVILILNYKAIPGAVVEIVQSAFGMRAVAGGALGAMMLAMQKGIARGIFSNEAGIGSAPIAAAAVQTTEPVRQGLVSMLGTVIDTIIICTMTGLSIVITGSWDKGLEGVAVTTRAFQVGLPFPAKVSAFILMLCLVFFAFTTILGWDYYSERCLDYLTGNNQKVVRAYRWIYIACVFIGPYMTVSAVWTIADIVNGLMAIPNLIALLALNGVVVAETKKYFKKF